MPTVKIRKSDVPPEYETKIIARMNEAIEKFQIEKVTLKEHPKNPFPVCIHEKPLIFCFLGYCYFCQEEV